MYVFNKVVSPAVLGTSFWAIGALVTLTEEQNTSKFLQRTRWRFIDSCWHQYSNYKAGKALLKIYWNADVLFYAPFHPLSPHHLLIMTKQKTRSHQSSSEIIRILIKPDVNEAR